MKSIKLTLIMSAILGLLSLNSCQPEPVACFEASPMAISSGQSVSFTSTCSMDAHHFEWNFGDGGTSMDASPSHVYNTSGSYTVRLKTVSKNGKKKDETSKTITVN